MRDLWWIAKILIIAFTCLVIIWMVFPHASAASVDVVQVPSNLPKGQPGLPPSIEIRQGGPESPEIIYQNETADLNLVKGWYGIVQRYPGDEMIDVSGFSHKIFIDPILFPEGIYYQWSPEGIFSHGNNIAFEVKSGIRPIKNRTFANVTGSVSEVVPGESPESLPLRSIPVADYYIARGDPFTVGHSGPAQVWVTQLRDDGGLGWMVPKIRLNSTDIHGNETDRFQIGNYTVTVQGMGPNGVADITYRNVTRTRSDGRLDDVLISPMNSTETIISGWQPWMIQKEVVRLVNQGMWVDQGVGRKNLFDDSIEMRTLVVENPYAEIREINEMSRGNSTREATIVQIIGYTNLAEEAEIKIVLDIDETNARTIKGFTWNTTAIGRNIGDKRQFSVSIPLYYSEMSPGKHFMTAITPSGVKTTVSFHIYDIPEGQVRPMATQRYMGGNEFVATPTPEIIEKTLPTPTPVVQYVYVTPSPTPTPEQGLFDVSIPGWFIIVIIGFVVFFGWIYWKWYT